MKRGRRHAGGPGVSRGARRGAVRRRAAEVALDRSLDLLAPGARRPRQVNDALEHFRFHEAAHVVYHFFWGDFCDWYIEWVKPELLSADRAKPRAAWKNLFAAFESGAAAAASLHAISDRGIVAPVAASAPERARSRSIAFPEPRCRTLDAASRGADRAAAGNHHRRAQHSREMKLDPKAQVPAADSRLRSDCDPNLCRAESSKRFCALATSSDFRIRRRRL